MASTAQKKNSGLGRGLGALLGDAPATDSGSRASAHGSARSAGPSDGSAGGPSGTNASASADVGGGDHRALSEDGAGLIPIEYLNANPDQPRRLFNDDAIAELAASLKARGMLQPILVRPVAKNAYEIVAGERRWRAAQKAQLHEVPVIIRKLTDEQTAEIALIENVQRVDLNPVEEAEAYHRLSDVYGRSQEEIAKAVGKSRSHIANLMRLLQLPPGAMEALKAGTITMGHARALLAAPKPDDALAFVINKGLSVRETEKLCQTLANGAGKDTSVEGKKPQTDDKTAKPARSLSKDADTRALENDLAAALGLEVALDHSKKGSGEVSIRYQTLDQLDDICRRLMQAGI